MVNSHDESTREPQQRRADFWRISEEGQGCRSVVGIHGALVVIASLHREVSVVMQNGRVLKSGYEEGYFRRPSADVDDEIATNL